MTVPPDFRAAGTPVVVQRGWWTTYHGTLTGDVVDDALGVRLDRTGKVHQIPVDDLTALVCPDGGACHHGCARSACFRVRCCGPLGADEWPPDVLAAHGAQR